MTHAAPRPALSKLFATSLLLIALAPTGCHELVPVLSDVAAVVADGGQVLTLIQSAFTSVAAENHFSTEQVIRVQRSIDRAWLALNTATRAVRGTTDLNRQDYDAAFGEFRVAYADLTKILQELGVVGIAPSGQARVLTGASVGRELPTPLALEPHE